MKNKELPDNLSKQKYKIAGLNVGMILRRGGIIETQGKPYLAEFEGNPQIVIGLNDEYIASRHEEAPHLSETEHEYMWTGAQFAENLLRFDGFMLHASAVVYKGKAYLFSAASGTGKSTHTQNWIKAFGKENAYILNDDKPVLRLFDEGVYAYGTPWSGKTDWNRNEKVILGGVCFLERSSENHIEPISAKEAVYLLLNQTLRPQGADDMSTLLTVMEAIISRAKVFKMGCNMDVESAKVAFKGMNGE